MSEEKTTKLINAHRFRVFKYLSRISQEIMRRGNEHDCSKLCSPELEIYSRNVDEFDNHPFGSPEYVKAIEQIMDAKIHHWKFNRHHPEHFKNGIEGMNLVDLMEMLCDWKSATLNHPRHPGDMRKSVEIAAEKYKISPQLVQILYNTMRDFDLE